MSLKSAKSKLTSFGLSLALVLGVVSGISVTLNASPANAAQGSECVIGQSSACPATSPQEIVNLYGSQSDGTYWIKANGTATQVYVLMNQTNSDGGGWVLLMKGAKGTTNFAYNSTNFTSNISTLATTSLTNDVTSDAKFEAYNSLSVKKLMAVFKDPTYGTISATGTGSLNPNAFGGHVWEETLASANTAYSTLITANQLQGSAYANINKYVYMDSSSGSTRVFSTEAGNAQYGFNISACGSSKNVRWGAAFNNEGDWSSCDTYVGIGLSSHSPGDQVTWQDSANTVSGSVATYTTCGSAGTSCGHGNTGFQIWGRVADPSLGAPTSLAFTRPSSGRIDLTWSAPAGVTATDYVVQYKTAAASSYSNSFIVSGQTSATITGLTDGTSYNFRVFARTANDSTSSANISSSTTSATPNAAALTPALGTISYTTPGSWTAPISNYDAAYTWACTATNSDSTSASCSISGGTVTVTPGTGKTATVTITTSRTNYQNGTFTSSSYYAGCTTTDISLAGSGYTTLSFNTIGTCNWSSPNYLVKGDVLVVGAGGGGGNDNGGGGGGGQVKESLAIAFTAGAVIPITVGAGGLPGCAAYSYTQADDPNTSTGCKGSVNTGGNTGGSSVFAGNSSITSLGGNGAVGRTRSGTAASGWDRNGYHGGGVGIGQSETSNPTAGANAGGGKSSDDSSSGGGGGAGISAVGAAGATSSRGGAGGAGFTSAITGICYGGGGGGGSQTGTPGSAAANCGGANGTGTSTRSNAAVNRGGGGGGGGNYGGVNGGTGGSGVVVVRYASAANTPTFGSVSNTSTGFTVNITNYDSNYTYSYSASPTATVTPGTASGGTLPLTITGLTAGQSSTITVSTSANGFTSSASFSGTATTPLTPTFGTISYGPGTVTIPVTNYDANFTFTPTVNYSSGTGTTTFSDSGSTRSYVITPGTVGTSVSLTVTTQRSGYSNGSATTSSSYYPGCNPTSSTSGGYTTLKFISLGSCNWVTPSGITKVEVAVVGGGGGGGFGNLGGGGGAGEVLVTGTTSLSNGVVTNTSTISATSGSTTLITIGEGGTSGAPTGATATDSNYASNSSTSKYGGDGNPTSFGSITAYGGGGGGGGGGSTIRLTGANGGSGGGGAANNSGGSAATHTVSGWTAYANRGLAGLSNKGAGGGGAGGASVTGTANAGPGVTVLGFQVAGGGGGWADGLGGNLSTSDTVLGGNARTSANLYPYTSTVVSGSTVYTSAGVNGTGNGGGAGAPGGSGVVIIRYASAALTPTFSTSASTTTGFAVNITNYDPNYIFTYSSSPTATVTPGVASGSTLPLTITGLTAGQSSTITVSTSANGFNGSATVSGSAYALASAPTNLVATAGNGQVSISFTAGANGGSAITNYKYSIDGTNYTAFATPVTTSPVVITGLTNGTAYTIYLKAVTSAGDGTASSSVTSTPITTPSSPTSLVATPGNGQLSIAFTSGATGGSAITNYKYSIDGTNYTAFATPVTSSPVVITGLTNGTSYTIYLKAVNSVGDSAASTSVTATPYTTPGSPTGLVLTSSNTSVSLSWTAPSSTGGNAISDYLIEYQLKGASSWSTFAHTASSSTSISVTSLTANLAYNFRVSAVNGAGTGSASAIRSTMTIAGMLQYLDASDSNSYTSGTTWTDLTGKGYNATLNGSPTFSTDRFTLNGTNQYFSVGSTTTFGFSSTSDFTVSVLFSQSEIVAGPVGLYTKWNQTQGGDWSLQLNDGKLVAARNYTPYAYTQAQANDINRKLLATYTYTRSTSTIKLYVNGSLVGSATVPTSTYNATPLIGARYVNSSITNFFKGDIYSASIFDNALTLSQIQALFANLQPTSKVVFSANSGSGTMVDQSFTNGNSVTLSSNTFTKTGYSFSGWNTSADGSGTAYADSANGALYGDTFLFAQWTAVSANIATPSSGLSGTIGTSFTLNNSVSGGSGSGTYSLASGSLPSSVTLNSSTGVISGTPSSAGTFAISVRFTDSNGSTATTSTFSIVISSLKLTTPSAPSVSATSGAANSITVTFTSIPNATSYIAQLFDSGGTQIGSNYTSFTSGSRITGLATSTTYGVKIIAVGDGTNYTNSDTSVAATTSTSASYFLNSTGNASNYASSTNRVIPATGNFTLEAWISPTDYNSSTRTSPMIFSQGTFPNYFYLKLGSTGKLTVVRGNMSGVECSNSVVPKFVWSHVAISVNGTSATCYLNGVAQLTINTLATDSINAGFYVGGYSNNPTTVNATFAGLIDEVKVWSTVRSQLEISANMEITPAITSSGLISYFPFDSSTGTSAVDLVGANNLTLGTTMSWLPLIRTISYGAGTYGSGTTASQTSANDHTTPISIKNSTSASGITRTNYSLSAWNTDTDGTSGTSYAMSANYLGAVDLTLYPTWTGNALTVTYDSQGGTSVASGTANIGASITSAPTAPTKAGYTFAGWATTSNGTAVTFPYAHGQTTNFTLYALWTINTYTVTYDGNGSTGGSVPTDSSSPYNYNSTVTVKSNSGSLVKTGYTFVGWNSSSAGTGTDYAVASTFTLGAANVTLYAKWITTCSVTPDATIIPGYTTYKFTSTSQCAWTNSTSVSAFDIALVGGGGAPGYGNRGGGGGAGQVVISNAPVTVSSGAILLVTVGNGGSSVGTTVRQGFNGDPTSLYLGADLLVSALGGGGGGGGGANKNGLSGGSGGGGIGDTNFGTSTGGNGSTTVTAASPTSWTAYGNSGGGASSSVGNAGGGGGAGAAGTRGPGGIGIALWGASDTSFKVAGGGAGYGGANTAEVSSYGGGTANTAGGANKGGGGGYSGTAGGSGLVVLRYANAYTVTYDYNSATGGNTTTSDSFTTGGTAITLPTPTKTNYTFGGWYSDSGFTTLIGAGGASYSPNGSSLSITAYAKWTTNTYTVTYSYNGADGGNSSASGSFTTGGTAITLPTPTKTGYSFAGWYSDSGLTSSIGAGGASYSPTGATTSISIYAKWTLNNYSITYNGNSNSSGSAPSSGSADFNSTYTVASNSGVLVRTGYTFGGWNTLANGSGTNYTAGTGSLTMGSANLTLYAKWNINTYTVTYDGNSNTGGTVPVDASSPYNYNSTVTAKTNSGTLVRNGYTFAGWNTAANGSGTDYAANGTATFTLGAANVTLYAKWTANSYTVTYSYNSATGGNTTTTSSYTSGGTAITLPTPTRTGYSFEGWYSDSGFSNSIGGAGASYSPTGATLSITAYAKWATINYSVTYTINGGSGTAPTETAKTIGAAFSVKSIGAVTKTGYDFTGWSDGTNTYQPGTNNYTMGSANVVFVAQWSRAVYTVTYSANSGTGSGSRSSDSYTYGDAAITLPSIGTLARTGYSFGGWSLTNNGSAISGTYTPTQSITIYAVWNPNTYTITYNRNGASGSVTNGDTSYTTGGTAATLPTVGTMTKTGYNFAGWSTSANGVVIGTSTYTTTANVTLYAIWNIKNLSITYNKGLAGGVTPTLTLFPSNSSGNYGTTFNVSSTIDSMTSSNNYAFSGWSDGTNIYAKNDLYRIGDSNITLTAQWTAIYAVRYYATGGALDPADAAYDSECTQEPTDHKCSNGQAITVNANPTRTGYTFAGWKDQSGNAISNTTNGWSVSSTSYLAYATWTADNYSAVYKSDGADQNLDASTYHIGDLITVKPGITKTGYVFNGWLYNGQSYAENSTIQIGSASIEFVAQWSAINYNLVYDSNGGSAVATPSSTKTYQASFTTANAPTRDGYTFASWSDGSTTKAAGASVSMPAQDVTYTAQWTANNYSVSYDPNGGTGTPTSLSNKHIGDTFTVGTAPSLSNRNFLGWSDGSNTYLPGQSYTVRSSNVSLTATWSGQLYTVTYLDGGGSGSIPTEGSHLQGESFAIETGAGLSRTGFAFDGWDDGNGHVYAHNDSFTVGSSNITLTAKWRATQYFVSYSSGTNASAHSDSTFNIGGSAIKLPTPTRANYVFEGWYDASSGGNKIGNANDDYSPAATKTLYGRWTQASLFGVTSSLTELDSYTTNNLGDRSATLNYTGGSISVRVPNGALPTGTVVKTSLVGDLTRVKSLIANNNNYILNLVVSWLASDTTVPDTDPNKPITMSITSTSIKKGAAIYSVVGTTATLLGYATQDGSADITLYSDPEIAILAVAPDAPTNVTATAGNASATVNWTAPTNVGGAAITGYTVTSSDGQTCTTTGTTSCTVSGLTNGSGYTFTVTATNSAGTSSPSSASSSVTPQGSSAISISTSSTGTYGTAQTITATLTNTNGSVNFKLDGTSISGCGTVQSSSLSATCSWTPAAVNSSAAITAELIPSTQAYSSSSSSTVNVNVGARAITIDAANKSAAYTGNPVSVTNSYSITSGSLYGSDAIGSISYGYSTSNPTNAGTYTITPSNAVFSGGSASNYSITYTTGTLTISTSSLIVALGAAPTGVKLGENAGTHSVSASTTPSGIGTITFGSTTTSVCTVNASTGALSILTSGTCTITADNSGDGNYSAASQDSQSFNVAPIVITFDANGTSSAANTQNITDLNAANLTSNSFTRTGYTFSGWNTVAGGTGTAYSDGSNITTTSDLTLYAQWTAQQSSNSNSNSNSTPAPEPIPVTPKPSRPVVPAAPEVVTPSAPVTNAADGTSVIADYSNTMTLIDGVLKEEKLTVVDTTKVVTETQGIKLELQILSQTFQPVPVSNEVQLTLEHTGIAQFAGNGFKPTTTVKVWLFSDPIYLGEYVVDKNGKFNASFLVLENLPVGEHLLQINGVTGDSKLFSQSIPVVVKAIETQVKPVDPTTPEEKPVTPVTPVSPDIKKPLVTIYFKNTSAKIDNVIIGNFKKYASKIKGAKSITCIAYKISSKYSDKLVTARAKNVCSYLNKNFGGVIKVYTLPISKAATKSLLSSKTRNGRVDVMVVK